MRNRLLVCGGCFLALSWVARVCLSTGATPAGAQDASPAELAPVTSEQSQAGIPRLVRFDGVVKDLNGNPATGATTLTFSIYSSQQGSEALWQEVQTITLGPQGRYAVLLGATKPDGLPLDLFTKGEARWLGVQVQGEPEQPRILVVSVPYALKAGDAETLGGKPASAYMLAPAAESTTSQGPGTAGATGPRGAATPDMATPGKPKSGPKPDAAGTGTQYYIPVWTDSAGTLGNSVIYQSSGLVGIGTTAPGTAVDVYGANAGLRLFGTGTHQVTVTGSKTSGRFGQDSNGPFVASDTPGAALRFLTNNGALNEWMRVTSAGKVGIGTMTPATQLDVLGGIRASGGSPSVNGEVVIMRDDLDSVHEIDNQAGSQMHFRLSRAQPDGRGAQHFVIAPYVYGMGFEYPGVMEFYSQEFSVHKSNILSQGAYFWVGDETDSGGLFVTSHDSGDSTTSYALLAADKFGHTSHGSMHFQVRNVTDAFRFQSGAWNLAVTTAQIGTETSATNFDVFSGTVQGRLRADASTGAVQLGSSSSNRLDFFTSGGAPQMTLLPNGNVGIGTTSPGNLLTVAQGSASEPIADAWTTYSSRRWKTNIQPIEGALEKVENLRGVYFDWKASGKHDLGLIAEEVGKVVPEVVAYEKDGRDAKSVDYARLTALLVEALKQQQAEIVELKSEMQRFDAQLREGMHADLIPKPQASVHSSFPDQSCSR